MGLTRTTGQTTLDLDLLALEKRLRKVESAKTVSSSSVITTPTAAAVQQSPGITVTTPDGATSITTDTLEIDTGSGLGLVIDGNNAKLQGALAISGTGFAHVTSGALDSAARTVDVSSADITGVLKAAAFPALTGDITTAGGALATSLKATGPGATGPIGSSSVVPVVTIDAQGRVTALSSASISTGVSIGSAIGSGTAKSVLFVDGSGNLAQDNANFSYDSTKPALGIGTASPTSSLHIQGNTAASQRMDLSNDTPSLVPQILWTRSRGTLTSQTDVQSGDALGDFIFRGVVSSSNKQAVKISSSVDVAPGAGCPGRLTIFTSTAAGSAVEAFRIDSAQNVGIGVTAPTAKLHLKAGTATASTAPLKFTSGVNLTTPEAGAHEWDGTKLYITQTSGPTRKTLAYDDAMVGDSGSGGTKGLVPAPGSGDAAAGKYLKADGTWAALGGTGILPAIGLENQILTVSGGVAAWTDTAPLDQPRFMQAQCGPTTTIAYTGMAGMTLGASNTTADLIDSTGSYMTFTGSGSNNTSIGLLASNTATVRRDLNPDYITVIQTGNDITSIVYWLGFGSVNLNAGTTPVHAPTTQHVAAFRYDTSATDVTGQWSTVTCDGGGTPTVTTSVGAIAASTKYVLRVRMTSGGHCLFYINGNLVADHSTHIPTATQSMGFFASASELVAATRKFSIARICVKSDN